jgi:hypothetical protein
VTALASRRLLITGGGCYGTHYARQLLPVLARGAWAGARIEVLDRDPACAAAGLAAEPGVSLVVGEWGELLAERLEHPTRDWLVPAPLTPHLFAGWLGRALSRLGDAQEIEPPFLPETPFARLTGTRMAVSFAEWRCPTHCVEPAICPATRQPKSWDLGQAFAGYALRLREAGLAPLAGPFVARLAPVARGISGFPLSDWARAARQVRALLEGSGGRRIAYVLGATVSSCHGAATLWRVSRTRS